MELTIDEALRQGIAAHKEGKLEEAEKLYTAILQSQPKHPDANHNMGILAVGVGKIEQAIPFFKAALESNPKIEQFWLSYIDSLIQLGQLDNARSILKDGQRSGLKGDAVDQLESRLRVDAKPTGSLQGSLNHLAGLYNAGKLEEALAYGAPLSKTFPGDANIPNILGASHSGLGQYEEAIAHYNRAIELKPNSPEIYNNLGIAFKSANLYEEAISNYHKAIELKSDYAEAYNNLGNAFNKLGRYEEAVSNFNKVLEINSV